MAGKTISEVNGDFDVAAYSAKEEKETKKLLYAYLKHL
jgi:hypothetical protein